MRPAHSSRGASGTAKRRVTFASRGHYRWARFTLTFDDGGRLMLVGPRRLGRVRLNPPVEQMGPDAGLITAAQFRAALAGGAVPVKARLMDQIHPARVGSSLTSPEQSRLLRASRSAIMAALRDGEQQLVPV
jgi:formamidopyrimidine-DNA glycosylase